MTKIRAKYVIIAIIVVSAIAVGVCYFSQEYLAPKSSLIDVPLVETAKNWAGYVAASDLQNPQPVVIGVSGSWVVPSITDIGTDAFSAIWVGIGGEFDQTLIQVGTEQDSINGIAQYSVWYELLPNDSITIDTLVISPGDQIEASINLIGSYTNQWSISITDVTTGQNYENNFTYTSGNLSAEWIVERPEVDNAISYWADFGTVTFTSCRSVFKNKVGVISDFSSNEVLMDAQVRHNQLVQLVDVSELSSDGSQFTVTFLTG